MSDRRRNESSSSVTLEYDSSRQLQGERSLFRSQSFSLSRDLVLKPSVSEEKGSQGVVDVRGDIVTKREVNESEIKMSNILFNEVKIRGNDWNGLVEIIKISESTITMRNAGWTLEQFLNSTSFDPRDIETIDTIIMGISLGLSRLHSLGFIHRDIAARNIYIKISDGIDIRIGDYGLLVKSDWAVTIQTPEYFQLEQTDKVTTTKTDSFSLGLILKRMLTLCQNPLLSYKVDNHPRYKLMRNLLSENPLDRPTPKQVRSWIKLEQQIRMALSQIDFLNIGIDNIIDNLNDEKFNIRPTEVKIRKGLFKTTTTDEYSAEQIKKIKHIDNYKTSIGLVKHLIRQTTDRLSIELSCKELYKFDVTQFMKRELFVKCDINDVIKEINKIEFFKFSDKEIDKILSLHSGEDQMKQSQLEDGLINVIIEEDER